MSLPNESTILTNSNPPRDQQRKQTYADAIVTTYLYKVEPIFHALYDLRETVRLLQLHLNVF